MLTNAIFRLHEVSRTMDGIEIVGPHVHEVLSMYRVKASKVRPGVAVLRDPSLNGHVGAWHTYTFCVC